MIEVNILGTEIRADVVREFELFTECLFEFFEYGEMDRLPGVGFVVLAAGGKLELDDEVLGTDLVD